MARVTIKSLQEEIDKLKTLLSATNQRNNDLMIEMDEYLKGKSMVSRREFDLLLKDYELEQHAVKIYQKSVERLEKDNVKLREYINTFKKAGRKESIDLGTKDLIVEDYKKIKSYRKVAEKYNVSKTTVAKFVKKDNELMGTKK